MAELGVQGLAVMLLLMLNAFKILSRIRKDAVLLKDKEDVLLSVYALQVALVIFFVASLFITETYIEKFYWLLMMPLFLQRAVTNVAVGETQAVPRAVLHMSEG